MFEFLRARLASRIAGDWPRAKELTLDAWKRSAPAREWISHHPNLGLAPAMVVAILFLLIAGQVAVAATLIGAWFALARGISQAAADFRRRINETYSKAVSQLASDKLEERLGGIYTLENISKESSDDYWTVMENLTAFVRERTQRTAANPEQRRSQRLKGRANALWKQAGQPDGLSVKFWEEAEKQEPPYQARMPGPRPRGERAMSVAERSAAYRARRKAALEDKAPAVRIRYRRPADKRSRPVRWRDAVETLADLIENYQAWRDSLPPSLTGSEIADRLDEVLTWSTSSPRPSCRAASGGTEDDPVLRPVTTGSCPLTMRADQHELPTPRTTLHARYVRVLVWCKSCRRRRDADLQALIDAGRGDVPLIHLRFRCSNCGSGLTDFVVTATEATGLPR